MALALLLLAPALARAESANADTATDAWFISNVSAVVPASSAACVPDTNSAGGGATNVFNDVDC